MAKISAVTGVKKTSAVNLDSTVFELDARKPSESGDIIHMRVNLGTKSCLNITHSFLLTILACHSTL